MYENKLVCAVKHKGRVLREQGDTVFLPYGVEYTLLFRNLNTVRALVRVSVDGTDATKGTSLIVPANGTVELERFLEAGQMDKGHKFKFIERTTKIEDGPRGIKAEDGLIRVEFEFERQPAKVEYETIKWPTRPAVFYPMWNSTTTTTFGSATPTSADCAFGNTVSANAATPRSPLRSMKSVGEVTAQAAPVSDVGITVPGAVSEQKFEVGAWFPTDGQKHVMVLKLLGQVGEQKVEKPVTVKTKTVCPTCGTKNKFGTKFCRECGTGLELL